MSMPDTNLVGGKPVYDGYTELKDNGQQKDYLVLSAEERDKGFVRPLRMTYTHVGRRPRGNTRELTEEEKVQYAQFGYVLYEEYGPERSPILGRYWTAKDLKSGCGWTTKMSYDIAATYARDPYFYGGTFCVGCGQHHPLEEFVWENTNIQVGT